MLDLSPSPRGKLYKVVLACRLQDKRCNSTAGLRAFLSCCLALSLPHKVLTDPVVMYFLSDKRVVESAMAAYPERTELVRKVVVGTSPVLSSHVTL